MNSRSAALLILVALAAVPTVNDAASNNVTVPMKAMSGSGQSGTATISRASSNHITITIDLNGEPAGASEPAMIRAGSCTDPNPGSKQVLNPLVQGRSVTTFMAPAYHPGPRSIVVHKGVGSEMDTIVSCGDIHLS